MDKSRRYYDSAYEEGILINQSCEIRVLRGGNGLVHFFIEKEVDGYYSIVHSAVVPEEIQERTAQVLMDYAETL